MTTEIPQSMSQMTPSWFTQALAPITGGATITDVAIEPLSEGVGFIGEVAKLELTYAGDVSGPTSLIGKIPIAEPGGRALGLDLRLYEREAAFYRQMASQVKIRVPTCYYNAADVEAGQFCLLLEDLGSLSTIDQRDGASVEQAIAVLEAIAPFHARWQGDRADQFDWLPRINDPMMVGFMSGYDAARERMRADFADHLDERNEATADRLAPNKFEMLERINGLPSTVVHGDLRLDNMFFDKAGVVLFDWQVLTRTTPMYDVVYFLGTNVSASTLTNHHEQILKAYADAVSGSGGSALSVDEMMSAAQTIWGALLFLGPVVLTQLDYSSEAGTALFNAVYERYTNAANVFNVHDIVV
jgi:hypothetical protein